MDNNSFEAKKKNEEAIEALSARKPGLFSRLTDALLHMGLGESMLRVSTNVLSILAIGVVIWLLQTFTHMGALNIGGAAATQPAAPTEAALVESIPAPVVLDPLSNGILRQADIHTVIPQRPRQDILKYAVQTGDSVIGIAEKFGLKPESILFANYNSLLDDPHNLLAGQELTILPVDGTYYEWQKGDGLNGVAKYFGVEPEEIVNFPGNHLDPNAIGDFANPNIAPGTDLIVPGGTRQFVSWSAPLGVTRENAAYARVLGPGVCDPVAGGAIGTGTFIYPTAKHYLSGFDYTPKINHYGIDLAGNLGEGVYATDGGVIVYAGWNNYGYGNMIMIDHGDGFQSLYGHLSQIYVSCGQSVGQGAAIGAVGSTGRSSGPHLHFEIMTATVKINPWDVLPAP